MPWGNAARSGRMLLQIMGNCCCCHGAVALRIDPSLRVVLFLAVMQPIFDDVLANGPEAFSKYWDDSDLMTKVRL